ncbi:ImmA/IrrE family metallo-endopeptidase [Cytobacillus purgationiresistens]|uniref:Zn-dependent peptidase ImmA (M78 family) n=1 Tax=Cytobacillus purgationiresistens TaxID=863449 RepID=A0ABU0AFF4_9BACI|nr:ImmA/IrrE family metallo-endopeptidase [Cytobacillus purgationiresistens]MDQ0269980.1 Zn-dependent peptidase ImmA (M78 family) [Cytobacillus purgationiresistens]
MDIKGIVKNLIRKHKTACPFELAKKLKIEVVFVNLGKKVLGFYTKHNQIPVITINENADSLQQIFILFHEIGHHVLHKDINTPFLSEFTLFSTIKIEIEAHTFALEFLFFNKEVITEEDLEMYGVPKQLALLRKYGS